MPARRPSSVPCAAGLALACLLAACDTTVDSFSCGYAGGSCTSGEVCVSPCCEEESACVEQEAGPCMFNAARCTTDDLKPGCPFTCPPAYCAPSREVSGCGPSSTATLCYQTCD